MVCLNDTENKVFDDRYIVYRLKCSDGVRVTSIYL